MEQYLQTLYHDPNHSGSFGGVEAVYRAVKDEGKFKISRKKIRIGYQHRIAIHFTSLYGKRSDGMLCWWMELTANGNRTS